MPGLHDRVTAPITRLWKEVHGTGLERFELLERPEEWIPRGTILRLHEGRPVEVRYSIQCDSRWCTVSARIQIWDDTSERSLLIENRGGRWTANGVPQNQVDAGIDIDLGSSPSTNTLPIRRLDLASGADSGFIVAVWVKFPELVLEPLPQEYRRLTDRTYRYNSRAGAFTADLLVDEHGLVEDYKGLWPRV